MTLLAGSAVVHPSVDTNPPGMAQAFVFTAVTSGSAKVMQLYLDVSSTASRVILGLYSDSAGKPGARLARVTLTTPKAGAWNTFTLPSPVSISAGVKYWIAVLTPTGYGNIKFRDIAHPGGGAAYVSSSGSLTNLPATFTVGASYQCSPVSAYAAVSVVTDTPPPPPPAVPVVTVSCAPASVAEDGAANLVYTFARTGDTSAPLTVAYTVSGSATSGTDYAAVGASVTFAAGASTASVTINPAADVTVESDETVVVTLTGSGYTIGTSGSASGTIANDDSTTPPPPPPTGGSIPLSWDDPMFASVTETTSRVTLAPGQSLSDRSFIEQSGEPTITAQGSVTLNRIRIRSREGYRGVSGTQNLTNVFIDVTGIGSDHADGLQMYSPGDSGAVILKNSTIRASGEMNAAYFSADNWMGTHTLENVLLWGGNYAFFVPGDGGSSVSLKNVYFMQGATRYGAIRMDIVNGKRPTILLWENVRYVTIQNGQLVMGAEIPRPY